MGLRLLPRPLLSLCRCGEARMGGLVEGRGCVCNVNRPKATDRMARGEGLIRYLVPSEHCLMVLFSKADMRRICWGSLCPYLFTLSYCLIPFFTLKYFQVLNLIIGQFGNGLQIAIKKMKPKQTMPLNMPLQYSKMWDLLISFCTVTIIALSYNALFSACQLF